MPGLRKIVAQSIILLVCFNTFQRTNVVWAETNNRAKQNKDPLSEASIQFDFASGLLARNLYQECINEYNKFLSRYPNDYRKQQAFFNRAEAYFALGSFKLATADYLVFLKNKQAKLTLQANLRLGCCWFERRDYEKACLVLKALLKQNPPPDITQGVCYYLGRSLQEKGKKQQASFFLQKAIKGQKTFRDLARFALADLAKNTQQPELAVRQLELLLAESPGHKLANSARLRLAEALRESGKLKKAADSYKHLISSSRSTFARAQAYLGLGWVQIKQNNFAKAAESARLGLQQQAQKLNYALHYLLGASLLKTKDYQNALKNFALIKSGKFSAPAARKSIWSLLGTGKIDKAIMKSKEYLKSFPEKQSGIVHYLLATSYFRKPNYKLAAKHFAVSRNFAENPYREEAAFQYALALDRFKQDQEAAAAYAEFVNSFSKSVYLPAALLGYGQTLYRNKNFAGATKAYGRILTLDRANAAEKEQALNNQAICLYELKAYEKMDKCYQKILKDYPRSLSTANALYWIAWGEQRRANYKKAITKYQLFLQKHSKHQLSGRARYRLGMSYFQAGQTARAADVFFNILTRYPNIPVDQSELLWLGSYFMQKNKFVTAGTVYDAILHRHPDGKVRSLTLYYLAEIERGKKRYKKAIKHYQNLAGSKDKSFQSLANFGLAICLREQKKYKLARTVLNKVKFSPADPMQAALYLELGLLDQMEGKFESALKYLMRIGIIYDDIELCGKAMFTAGQICEKQNKTNKAIICYLELAGNSAGSYGERYAGKSSWSKKAKKRLAVLQTPQPKLPATAKSP